MSQSTVWKTVHNIIYSCSNLFNMSSRKLLFIFGKHLNVVGCSRWKGEHVNIGTL
jgi:hypothetical protein